MTAFRSCGADFERLHDAIAFASKHWKDKNVRPSGWTRWKKRKTKGDKE